jgi:hypothetical protein
MSDFKEINLDDSKTFFVVSNGKKFKFTLDEVNDFDIKPVDEYSNQQVTIVTGLWNLGRVQLSDTFKRSYDDYKKKFAELLQSPNNMYIYVSKADEDFIWQHRSKENTQVKIIELSEFETWFEFFEQVQNIRKTPEWFSQATWLSESPQAKLEYYNPVVMSKMFLLNDATFSNPFNTEYFYWIDAGITNTVHPGYFYHDKVLNNLQKFGDTVNKFTFLTYPYEGSSEIHGFSRKAMNRYANTKSINYVCRGGFFGGNKNIINKLNGIYHSILQNSLNEHEMGTEESIFTILAHLYPDDIYEFKLSEDGLVWPFFEKLKHVDSFITEYKLLPKKKTYSNVKNNLYILSFNSPTQFEAVCKSIKLGDIELFEKSNKILINNSTDETLFEKYDALCSEYGFDEIHRDNLGVCGGRQFIAEHFHTSDADFYMFFEDDMFINSSDSKEMCKLGFVTHIPKLYETVIMIMLAEKFDFLKFSFSEFYGDNSIQWAWYNVPQEVRTLYWPEYDKLPEVGLDPNAPKTKFDTIRTMNGISYITGEIYYSNWPQIVSREGNKKMFLDTTWKNPYEQTWMSYMYQLTKQGQLTSAVLLATPITHNRFDHYDGSLRKES